MEQNILQVSENVCLSSWKPSSQIKVSSNNLGKTCNMSEQQYLFVKI